MANLLLERLRQYRIDVVVAIESLDYETAYNKLLAVKAIIDTAPSRQEKDQFVMEFRDFESLMKRVETERGRAAGSGKLRSIPTQYVPYGSCCNDPYFDCL